MYAINLDALIVTNAMLRRLTTWRFIRPTDVHGMTGATVWFEWAMSVYPSE